MKIKKELDSFLSENLDTYFLDLLQNNKYIISDDRHVLNIFNKKEEALKEWNKLKKLKYKNRGLYEL